MAMFSNKF